MNRITAWILYALAALSFLCGSMYLYFHTPGGKAFLPQCIFYRVTHLYCPGCGGTRAYYSLLHGDFVMMFRYNPLLVPFLILALAVLLYPKLSANFYFVLFILFMILSYWVLRNIPMYPFTLLAPPPFPS